MMNKKQILGLFIIVVTAIFVVSPLLSGTTQIMTVMSDSMSPEISVGDMIIVKDIDPSTIATGDIVTYAPQKYGIVITHRVINIKENGDFVMKGDANLRNDINDVKPEQVIGKCVTTIPYLGYLAHYTRQPIGFLILIGLPALLLIGMEIKDMIVDNKTVKKQEP